MSFLTYIASDLPIPESDLLWPLSLGAEDIYTEKQYAAAVAPGLKDLQALTFFLKQLTSSQGETEVWRIWQGVEYRPVIRSREIKADELAMDDLEVLHAKDVANETTTSYGIPVQYRIVVTPK